MTKMNVNMSLVGNFCTVYDSERKNDGWVNDGHGTVSAQFVNVMELMKEVRRLEKEKPDYSPSTIVLDAIGNILRKN